MIVKRVCPCDTDGICPYEDMHSGYWGSCEYWCGADEPQDEPDVWEDDFPDYTEWYEQQEAEHEEEYYRRKKG